MANIRSSNEIILSSLDFFRVAQPLLDTKPGTVSRDLLVEGPATQISRLYDELNRVSSVQSLRTSIGSDLDKLAQNVGAIRNKGTKSQVSALFTFTTLDTDVSIVAGNTVSASNGVIFQVLNSVVVSSVLASSYKATAAKFRSDLDFVGITDQFAIQVLVEATSTGDQGNVSKYTLNKISIVGVSNVTNASPGSGGTTSETDANFRNRILAIFSGANTGTSLGYLTTVKADPSVIDAIVISPGDSLMTRDGTQVSVAADGTRTIISEGTGGKVDLIVYGSRLQAAVDSYIYHDLSNTNDPTNVQNNFILGQITADAGKTITRKRVDDLAAGTLPNQPVNNIVSVAGSRSGPNFQPKSVDNLGRVSGNYELILDTGSFGGSPFGSDSLHWLTDRISDFKEDLTKSIFDSQDPVSFPDVLEIQAAQQNITITNDNPKVAQNNRSSLQLSHSPVSSVTRVFNVTTGERYVVASQNPDGSGSINTTGRIIISGKTLPAVTDILQADYTWIFSYDPYMDFDNRTTNHNPRTVQDSVDWGFSNMVRRERAILTTFGSVLTATVTHSVNSVVSVNVFDGYADVVKLSSGRLFVTASTTVDNVVSITRASDGAELWMTNKADGAISGLNIYFPTDSPAVIDDSVNIIFNATDVFDNGSFSGNIITIVPTDTATAGTIVECTYIADVSILLPATLLPTLPAIRSGNQFKVSGNLVGTQPVTNLYIINTIVQNFRQAPSNLGLTISGNISPGVLTILGTTFTYIADVVYTVSSHNLKQDLTSAIKTFYNINSQTSISTNIRIAKIDKVELVTATGANEVLTVEFQYDLQGYKIFDNSFVKDESIMDTTLKVTEFILPTTPDNQDHIPAVGNKLRVRFHISTLSDSESVFFSTSGTLYTNKRFALVDSVGISSGFTSGSSSSATLTISNLNQPAIKSRYSAFYDYLAPKPNERITINSNFQKIINDATLAIESTRPITADVLVKRATPILIDTTLNIVLTSDFTNSASVILQNVQDVVTAALNANALGTTVDSSDLISSAYTVNGVDRVRVLFFNRTGQVGSVLSIIAQRNEYLVANTVLINLETR